MTPDDPRHGTNAGRSAGCRCPACKAAKVKYEKRRLAGLCGGTATLTDATGTKRRIHALMAIGWPSSEVAARLGVHESRVIGITRAMRVTHRTHAKVKADDR
jgi:DNA-binding CsgD family transcriptional regulator